MAKQTSLSAFFAVLEVIDLQLLLAPIQLPIDYVVVVVSQVQILVWIKLIVVMTPRQNSWQGCSQNFNNRGAR